MAGVIKNYSKFEVRAVVRFVQGVSQSEIHRGLVSVYGQKVFSRKTLNDDRQKHRSRPRASHTAENCHCRRFDKGRSKSEIAEVTGIAKSTVHIIISDLNFRKMPARWVPKMLTEEHRSKRMAASLENLCRYQDAGKSFVESIVTGDKTWGYEFTTE
jgi:DNA-binding NarL/FixJ family response regulator